MPDNWDCDNEKRKNPALREKAEMLERIIDKSTQKAAGIISDRIIKAAPEIALHVVKAMEARVIDKKEDILKTASDHFIDDVMNSVRLKVGDISIKIILFLLLIISTLTLMITKYTE